MHWTETAARNPAIIAISVCIAVIFFFLYWLLFLKRGDEKRLEKILKEEQRKRLYGEDGV